MAETVLTFAYLCRAWLRIYKAAMMAVCAFAEVKDRLSS